MSYNPPPDDIIGHCFVFGQIGIFYDGEKMYVRLLHWNRTKERTCKSKRK